MSAPVKFAIYTAVFLLLGAAIYFFAIWRPNARRTQQLHYDIAIAQAELELAPQRAVAHANLYAALQRYQEEFQQEQYNYDHVHQIWTDHFARFLPVSLTEDEMRQRIHHTVDPYGHGLSIEFAASQPLGLMRYSTNPNGLPQGIWLTPITIDFTTNYDGLVAILAGFAQEGIDNRVINYTLTRHDYHWNVRLRLDVLTQKPMEHMYQH